jgi:hypothetical protein
MKINNLLIFIIIAPTIYFAGRLIFADYFDPDTLFSKEFKVDLKEKLKSRTNGGEEEKGGEEKKENGGEKDGGEAVASEVHHAADVEVIKDVVAWKRRQELHPGSIC